MRELKDVHGSAAQAKPLVVGYNTVYVHSNIRQDTDENGELMENQFVYDEIQYDKDEYIQLMSERSDAIEEQATINRSDIDFLMVLNDIPVEE